MFLPPTHTRKTHTPTDTTPTTEAKIMVNNDNVNAPPPLTKDHKDTIQLMGQISSTNAFQNSYSMAKHLHKKLTLSHILKVFSKNMSWT